ncbi:hypothetical protein PPH41_41210, partial [Burkholderia gladioli]|nr:hypothetical protein [Burkholderia gladioli]
RPRHTRDGAAAARARDDLTVIRIVLPEPAAGGAKRGAARRTAGRRRARAGDATRGGQARGNKNGPADAARADKDAASAARAGWLAASIMLARPSANAAPAVRIRKPFISCPPAGRAHAQRLPRHACGGVDSCSGEGTRGARLTRAPERVAARVAGKPGRLARIARATILP